MIDVIKMTPREYSKQSRDYQILARLYTALFNVSKMYIDNLNVWNNNIDNELAQLRATTLNFRTEHYWDLDDLEAVTSCFKYLVRRKGTLEAIRACVYILMKIEKIDSLITEDSVVYDEYSKSLTITLEKDLLAWGVLEDLIKYILPCGITYRIIEETVRSKGAIESQLEIEDFAYFVDDKYSSDMLIGHNSGKHSKYAYVDLEGKHTAGTRVDWSAEGRVNYFTDTYVYSSSEGKLIPDFEETGGKRK